MRAKYFGVVVLGVTFLGACAVDGPAAPRQLFLQPSCDGVCFSTGTFAPSNEWLQNLSGTAGATTTIVAQVIDSDFHPQPGITMRWAVVSNRGSVDSATVMADSAAIVRIHWTSGTRLGSDSIRGWFPSGDSVLAIAEVHPAAPAFFAKISGDSQTVSVGTTPRPLVVRLTDRYGNSVQGINIAWTLGGLSSVLSETITTGADGTASNPLVAASAPGAYTIVATYPTLPALVFRVDVR